MGAFLSATFLIFRMHLSRLARSKRAVLCAVVSAIPPVFAWLVWNLDETAPTADMLSAIAWWMHLQVIVPLVALIAGSAVVNEEVENRTITFLFTRPMARAALFIGRWLATLVLVSILLVGGAQLVILGAEIRLAADGAEIAAGIPARYLWATFMGGATYSILFAMLGIFLRHPMIVGLGYVFAFEALIANLPGESQSLSVQFYLRSILVDLDVTVWRDIIPPTVVSLADQGDALQSLVIMIGAALALSSVAISKRQFVLTA